MKTKIFLLGTVLFLSILPKAYSQPLSVINAHFDGLAKHDVKGIASGYADSAKVYSPNWDGAKTGPTGVTEVYTRYYASTPDLSYKINHIINAGDEIVVEYTVTGTLSNPEGNTPAYMKNKIYTLNYCAVFSVKGGKIVRESDYFDQVAFLRQVGFFDQK
ncbi:MAG TPA: nuclear transport factor 2 family protein [Mucilaginibacter sp.]|jgi:steroid delta-isomerase-like uncharacterized protein|nr:nuclear transport factor 2 family protein [Mucilaginibacter sp.]